MLSMVRLRRKQALTALALALVVPATSFAADEADWGFRQSFRGYVYSGTGAPPITAAAGASCDPNPDNVRGGCDPKLSATTGVFGWTAIDSSYTLPSGAGTIDLQGNVTFTRPDHLFVLSVIDPIVTVASDGTAIVNAHIVLDSDLPSVPDRDERMNFGEFTLTSPVSVTATTVTWNLGDGAVTEEAATALGGFLAAGAELDPIEIVLPLPEPPPGTPVSSVKIRVKDDLTNLDKRGVAVSVTKEPLVVPADVDPTVDGATLRVVSSTFDDTYTLPASNWEVVLKKGVFAGYKYSDSKRLLGPISAAKITTGAFKIVGKGAALTHSLDVEPENLAAVLSSGDVTLCAGAGPSSKTNFKVSRIYTATKNAAPASCPAE